MIYDIIIVKFTNMKGCCFSMEKQNSANIYHTYKLAVFFGSPQKSSQPKKHLTFIAFSGRRRLGRHLWCEWAMGNEPLQGFKAHLTIGGITTNRL